MTSHSSLRRIIFVNRFFYPDHAPTSELLSDLAFELAARGFRVTIVTSRLNYDNAAGPLLPRERIHGVDIWRVWTSKWGRQKLLGRSLDYLTFYFAAAWRLWRMAHPGDTIVAKTDPPLLSMVAAPIAWLRGAQLVNWLQDIFPEVAEALNIGGSVGRLIFRTLRPLRNWSLHSAHTNVVVGEGMGARLQAQGLDREQIRVIPNWADGSLIRPLPRESNQLRRVWAPNSRFIVAYAGNLGRAHDVETMVDAMTLLQQRAKDSAADDVAAKTMFVVVGGGVQRARLEREVIRRQLTNVRMHPYQARQRLAETLGLADLHLVSLRPKLEGSIVPSKFYGIAAAGRPVIFIGASEGEIARLVDEFGCGFTVPPGDGTALMDRILQLAKDQDFCASMGLLARTAFEQHWDKSQAITKWEEVLKAVDLKTSATLAAENRVSVPEAPHLPPKF